MYHRCNGIRAHAPPIGPGRDDGAALIEPLHAGGISRCRSVGLLVSVISLFLFLASAARGDPALFPGIRKVSDPRFLERELVSELDRVGVIVLLEGYEGYVGRALADRANDMRRVQAEIAELQYAVLGRLDPAHFQLHHRYENLPGFAGEATLQGVRELAAHDGVALIEENRPAVAQLAQGLPLMNAMEARSMFDGQGVAVGIMDSGIDYRHERLGEGGFPNAKVIGGYNFDPDAANPDDPIDCNSHGTKAAGVVAGEEAAGPGDYIGGVAPAAKLYALKITSGCGLSTDLARETAAIDWAITHKNDDPTHPILVLNLSMGGWRHQSPCDNASGLVGITATVRTAVANGITIFAASGNNGWCESMAEPACLRDIISVGAVFDSDGDVINPCINAASCTGFAEPGCRSGWACLQASAADVPICYSNSADFLDLLAPSHHAHTTDLDHGYDDFSGTSCASPYAVGAAAVLQSSAWYRDLAYYTPDEIRSILVTTGEPVTDPKNSITTPRIDLGNFLATLETCDNGVDDDGDTLIDCEDPDCLGDPDGDTLVGVPCGPDCEPDDGEVWAEPAAIRQLVWDGKQVLRWEDLTGQAGTATTYQAMRGRVGELPVGSGSSESCIGSTVPSNQLLDFTITDAGDLFYFLSRGVNACSSPQPPYGSDSAGADRLSDACP